MRLWLWAVLPTLLLAGCNEKDAQLAHDSLLYCTASSPLSFNPQLVISTETLDATAHQLYDRLLTLDSQSQEPSSALARDWQRSDDGLRYRFRLRQNVAFHNTDWFSPTRTLNASDVVFSFTRLTDPQHPYHKVSGGRYPFFSAISWPELVKQVREINEHEVEFVLNYADADFLQYLASDYAVILSAEYATQLQAANTPQLLDQQPIGTGPFLLDFYRPDEFIRYHRHPDYWQANSRVSQLVFDITPKSSKRLAKLLTGECDVMANPAASQLAVIQRHPDLALSAAAGISTAVLAFNTQKPPFDDLRVRNAIRLAMHKDDILQAVYFGQATLAEHILPERVLPNAGWPHAAQPQASDSPVSEELMTDGLITDGLDTDGLGTDGLSTDGLSTDGLSTDGLSTDGLGTDGLSTDGLGTDGLVTDGLATDDLGTDDAIMANPAADRSSTDNSNTNSSSKTPFDRQSDREQDLAEARRLLAEAGLSSGFKMTLYMPAGARTYNPDGLKTGQLLQQQLAPLGIKLTLRALDEQILRNQLLTGQYDAVLTGWSADIPSPDNMLRNLLSCLAIKAGTNASRWCNPAFDVELNLALIEAEPARRQAYYQAAQYLAELDVALIPLVHSQRRLSYRRTVSGLQLLPYGGVNFQLAEKE